MWHQSFPFRSTETLTSEIVFRLFTHQNDLESHRKLNQYCRSVQYLSIPGNHNSFHQPWRKNFESQSFRSEVVILRSLRARFFKLKFLWWEGWSNPYLQLCCWTLFVLTYGIFCTIQIVFDDFRRRKQSQIFGPWKRKLFPWSRPFFCPKPHLFWSSDLGDIRVWSFGSER